MKTFSSVISCLWLISIAAFASQTQSASGAPPKYNAATEGKFQGTVEQVVDRVCPVSSGLGSHLLLGLSNGKTIEVHVAPTEFMNAYELVFTKGDQIDVTGSKVTFEGVETVFAREIKRGKDIFVFRDQEGNPAW
jgi:DNA/RNA endonuclease YhcR with UshA esterase domain